MILGVNQKELLKELEQEGVIYNLGNTYRNYSKSARQTTNRTILNFVEKVKIIYPNTTLTMGVKGGLGTATLKINK